jgi:hypothetical protein
MKIKSGPSPVKLNIKDYTFKKFEKIIDKLYTNATSKTDNQLKKMGRKMFLLNTNRIALNMDKFKNDFTIETLPEKKELDKLETYLQESILKKFKKKNHWGSIKNPVRLLLIKLLLNLTNDQSLKTIAKVFNHNFYLINDLKKQKKIYYIELKQKNDSWKIFLLKKADPKKQAPKFKKK